MNKTNLHWTKNFKTWLIGLCWWGSRERMKERQNQYIPRVHIWDRFVVLALNVGTVVLWAVDGMQQFLLARLPPRPLCCSLSFPVIASHSVACQLVQVSLMTPLPLSSSLLLLPLTVDLFDCCWHYLYYYWTPFIAYFMASKPAWININQRNARVQKERMSLER